MIIQFFLKKMIINFQYLSYINHLQMTFDTKQSIKWLENWMNTISYSGEEDCKEDCKEVLNLLLVLLQTELELKEEDKVRDIYRIINYSWPGYVHYHCKCSNQKINLLKILNK